MYGYPYNNYEYNLMMANKEAETCGCWQICKPPVANISCVWLYSCLVVSWREIEQDGWHSTVGKLL